MATIAINLPIYDYDHIVPLVYGDVVAEGIDLTIERGAHLARTTEDPTTKAGELSCAGYLMRLANGDRTFVGIPAFICRGFRHRTFFVRQDSNLHSFQELEGKRVGLTAWQDTGNTWTRAALREQGVRIDRIQWVIAPADDPARDPLKGRLSAAFPPYIQVAPKGKTQRDMLLAGELDAISTPYPPKGFYDLDKPMRRLLPDFRQAEKDYLKRTGIYPVFHLIGLRREVYEEAPWVARSIYEAFDRSRILWQENRRKLAELTPWILADIEESGDLLGYDWHRYGVEPNRPAIAGLCHELYAQGLIERPLDPATAFAEWEQVMAG